MPDLSPQIRPEFANEVDALHAAHLANPTDNYGRINAMRAERGLEPVPSFGQDMVARYGLDAPRSPDQIAQDNPPQSNISRINAMRAERGLEPVRYVAPSSGSIKGTGYGEEGDPLAAAGYYDSPEQRVAKGVADAPNQAATAVTHGVVKPVLEGGHTAVEGYNEGDPIKTAKGVAEVAGVGLGAASLLPRTGVAIADGLASAANAAYRTAPRAIATTAALTAPELAFAAQQEKNDAATKKSQSVENDPDVARIRSQLERAGIDDPGLKALQTQVDNANAVIQAASKPNNGLSKAQADRNVATARAMLEGTPGKPGLHAQIEAYRTTGPLKSLTDRLTTDLAAARSKAEDTYLANAPFRERNPGVAPVIAGIGMAGAAALPAANVIKENLAHRLIAVPSANRAARAVEAATDPSKFAVAQAQLNNKLDNLTAPGISPVRALTSGATSGLVPLEARALPDELDVGRFPADHPASRQAVENLKSMIGDSVSMVPTVAGGMVLGASGSELAHLFTRGKPDLSYAKSMAGLDFQSRLPAPQPTPLKTQFANAGRNLVEDLLDRAGLDPGRRGPIPPSAMNRPQGDPSGSPGTAAGHTGQGNAGTGQTRQPSGAPPFIPPGSQFGPYPPAPPVPYSQEHRADVEDYLKQFPLGSQVPQATGRGSTAANAQHAQDMADSFNAFQRSRMKDAVDPAEFAARASVALKAGAKEQTIARDAGRSLSDPAVRAAVTRAMFDKGSNIKIGSKSKFAVPLAIGTGGAAALSNSDNAFSNEDPPHYSTRQPRAENGRFNGPPT